MPHSKKKTLAFNPSDISRLTLINRWNICQSTASLMYKSAMPNEELMRIYNEFKSNQITKPLCLTK